MKQTVFKKAVFKSAALKKSLYALAGCTALLTMQVSAELPKLNIITEQYQPFNFVDPDDSTHQVQGIAVDLLAEMLARAGSTQTAKDVQMQPWARGYQAVQSEQNTLLFSTTRTAERESMFKWACPINELKTELIALKSANIKISDKSELIKYQIGTVRDDVGEQLVVAAGVPLDKLQRTTKYENNLKKVETSRIDLYVGSMESVASMCKTVGCDADKFEPVYTLDVSKLCYAFHKDTDDNAVSALQKALDELVAAGKLEELSKKYEKWK
jgi:polar amino acid transport system substrate-binding protein